MRSATSQIMRISVLAFLPAIGIMAARNTTMNVQVREAQVRAAPSYLSRILATAAYTESVEVLNTQGDWKHVRTPKDGTEGWMHATALTSRKLALQAGDRDAQTGVSSDEQALAGRGFNADVEKQFQKQNTNIDFAGVDRMEKLHIAPESVAAFIREGDLKMPGGAQ